VSRVFALIGRRGIVLVFFSGKSRLAAHLPSEVQRLLTYLNPTSALMARPTWRQLASVYRDAGAVLLLKIITSLPVASILPADLKTQVVFCLQIDPLRMLGYE